MTDAKLQAVVANWYPRFLANGIDWFDLSRTLDAIDGWDDWADAWTATADRYDALGREALADGHRVTAAEHLRRAALTLQFAQFVLTEDPERRAGLQARMSALYAEAAPLLDPPAVRVALPYAHGEVIGYLRRPVGVDRAGLAVLIPGLESTKEQFSTYEPYFLRRGVATLSVEGPGQGEGSLSSPFRNDRYAVAMAAVGAATGGLDGVDRDRVVVVGTSFGGHLALAHAGAFPGLRGVVDIAGPYDLRAFDELQPVTREGFREFVGADDEAQARDLLADVTLDGVLDRLDAPVLVVHGERDTIIAIEHAHRIVAALGDRATVRLEPEGNHSCNNLATVVRPAVADWVTDRLGERMTDSNRSGSSKGLRTVAQNDLNGFGDGMQVMRAGDAVYVGHFGPSGMGTSVLDASDATELRLVKQWKAPHGSHTHKVQVADGLLLVNHEMFRGGNPYSAGMAVYDLADPFDPQQIGWFDSTGLGVHRIVWEGGRYAYVSAIPEGFGDRIWVIVDMADPRNPVEAGRWWWPGQWEGGGETLEVPEGKRYAAHHALVDGDTAYLGYGDAGMVVLDISDRSTPRQIGHLNWEPGGDTHTCLPLEGRDLLVVTDEVVTDGRAAEPHYTRIVDVSDRENPRVVSICPPPPDEFYDRGLRFGPHNLHENRPGTYRSATLVFCTYFNAGLRVYDVRDAENPVEIAHWVPDTPDGQVAAQINDVFVGADLDIWVTDRVNGGVYRLEADDELQATMREHAL